MMVMSNAKKRKKLANIQEKNVRFANIISSMSKKYIFFNYILSVIIKTVFAPGCYC